MAEEIPPFLGTIQFAYTTDDMQADMAEFTRRLGVGPWFVTGPFQPRGALYRGQPTAMELTLAVAFTGRMTVELIQQHDDAPSVYRETVGKRGGHGFHHWGVLTEAFDADIARYQADGYEVAFTDVSPRGVRVAYLDTTSRLPGMIELMESTPALQDIYRGYWRAAQAWDGRTEPVREWKTLAPGSV